MSEIIRQLTQEKIEIAEKIHKLHLAIKDKSFTKLPEYYQEIIGKQYSHMTSYSKCLDERIDLETKNGPFI